MKLANILMHENPRPASSQELGNGESEKQESVYLEVGLLRQDRRD
jgi:hypothetical protein